MTALTKVHSLDFFLLQPDLLHLHRDLKAKFKVFVSKFVFVAEMRGDRDTWRGFRQLSSLIQGLSQSSQGE